MSDILRISPTGEVTDEHRREIGRIEWSIVWPDEIAGADWHRDSNPFEDEMQGLRDECEGLACAVDEVEEREGEALEEIEDLKSERSDIQTRLSAVLNAGDLPAPAASEIQAILDDL